MRRLLLGIVLALGLLAAPAAAPRTGVGACGSGFVDGVVGGEHKCLHAGEYCAARNESQYEKYGFSCVAGRLQSGVAAPPATTTPPLPVVPSYHPPRRTKVTGCRARGGLPDRRCTPGAVFGDATAAAVCRSGYSESVRNVPASERRAVFAEYGIVVIAPRQYEVDHLISLELGGSNDVANLWPEAALPRPGFHQKDALENRLHRLVCSGELTLADAQRLIATNWLSEYEALYP
jgi:hypothetical protein